MTEIVLANLAIFLAAATQASAGLGFAMVATPLLGLVSLAYLPGPMLFSNMFLSTAMLVRDRGALDPDEARPLGLGLMAGTLVGGAVLTAIPTERLGVLFALVILAAVALSVLAPQVPLRRGTVLAGAGASGFTGIVAGMHAPPLVMLYQREAPEKVRATFAAVFVFGCILALGVLAVAGRFGAQEAWMGLSLLPGIAIGFGAGRLIAGRISKGAARAAMLVISGAGGLLLLVKSL